MSNLLKISGYTDKPRYNKYDDPEYIMRRVITHSTRIRTLLTAIRVPFVGEIDKRRAEVIDLLEEVHEMIKKVLDTQE